MSSTMVTLLPFILQVTNQMITACKDYITVGRSETIWTLGQSVCSKLQDCILLNDSYRAHFHKVKAKLETQPQELQFDFSEMYIFGKFDTFSRRLKKIIQMFDIIETYSHLSQSKIEGTVMSQTKMKATDSHLCWKICALHFWTFFNFFYRAFLNFVVQILSTF